MVVYRFGLCRGPSGTGFVLEFVKLRLSAISGACISVGYVMLRRSRRPMLLLVGAFAKSRGLNAWSVAWILVTMRCPFIVSKFQASRLQYRLVEIELILMLLH